MIDYGWLNVGFSARVYRLDLAYARWMLFIDRSAYQTDRLGECFVEALL